MTEKKKVCYIFACILLGLNALWGINRGVDMMDAGYGLGNFKFLSSMDVNWKLATYLSNMMGKFLTGMPMGNTMLGMNIYSGLLLAGIAVATFLYLSKLLGHPGIVFLGEWIALSLCWAPTTVLYHYMSYFLLTGAVMLIVYALQKDRQQWLFVAGMLLGANVLVRLPNLTHMACIMIVWYDAWMQKKKMSKVLGQTGICIGGYVIGFGIPFLTILTKYGLPQYIQMIQWLFGMTESATDYKPTSMVTAMFGDYIQYAVWLGFMLLYITVGYVFFHILKGKWELLKKIIYVAGMLVLLRFFYGRGMFDFHYEAYFSMYKWMVVFLLAFWGVSIWFLVQNEKTLCQIGVEQEKQRIIKALVVGCMVVVIITPLGSNNGLYPIINNLFLPGAMTVYLLYLLCKRYQHFAVKTVTATLVICVLVQSTLFGVVFVFHDQLVGEEVTTMTEIPALKGMQTTVEKATELTEVYAYMEKQQLLEQTLIVYGDIPGLSYVLDMPSAIFSTWSDLASNPQERLQDELDIVTDRIAKDKSLRPVVILSAKAGAFMTEDAEAGRILEEDLDTYKNDIKLQAIASFIANNGYINTYTNQEFMIFE